jgi:2-keto-3-deoxy-L-fuconate dehydrogenase
MSPKISFSLKEKVAVVTGAASGIGAAIAEAFARAGALVYVADVNEAGAAAHARRIGQEGGRAIAVTTNVADQASCEALVQRVLAERAQCDVFVNNAGIGHVGTILTTPPEELQRLWSVNVQGMYTLCRAVLPAMIERKRGSIINMASALGLTAMEDRFAYTVTKHAVVGLTRSMALDFGPTGVRINCICPGRVETPFVQERLREYPDPEKFRAQMVATHAQKRMAQPWEIAAAAVYLASDESAFVTGSTFVIDGGYLCGK